MDRLTSEQRSKNMKAVRNKDTYIELLLRKELWSRGLRYRKNVGKVFGHPDIVFIKKRIAIFCDSEFWHGYDWENRKYDIKSRSEFWISKIESNIARDKKVNVQLINEGWTVIRFWGREIKKNVVACADIVQQAYEGKV